MMDQTEDAPKTNFEANVIKRQQNFVARAAGAVAASVTAVVTGKWMLKKSLRSYLQERLFARDWRNGNVEQSMVDLASGHSDTISGAITDPEKMDRYASSWLVTRATGETPHLTGTLVGDKAANKALKDLYLSHLEPNSTPNFENPHEMKLKPGMLKTAVDNYKTKLAELEGTHKKLTAALEKKFFKTDPDICRAEIANVRTFLEHETDSALRDAKVKEFSDKKLFNEGVGNVHKFLERESIINENLKHYSNKAKQQLVDKPIYDEMMKAGTEAGRMGLKLRHAHNKRELIAFTAGATVAVGYMTTRMVNKYLHRNDARKDDSQSFQASVTAQREAAQATGPAVSHV